MMNQKSISIFIAFFALNICIAQESITQTGEGRIIYFTDNVKIDGNQFLYDDWQKATLVDYEGNISEHKLNYDGIKSRFVSNLDSKQGVYLNIYKYKTVVVTKNDEKHQFESLLPFKEDCYGKIIYDGEKYKVFEKFSAKKRKINSNAYGDVSAAYKFSKSKKLYISVDGKLVSVNRSGKSFSKVLKNKKIKKIVKSEKLDLDKNEDIAKLFMLIQ